MTFDPLRLAATPARLQLLADAGVLPAEELERARVLAAAPPPRSWWAKFLSSSLLGLGALLVLAGVIYFFAFNWSALGRFDKLGLLAVAIALAAAAAWRLGDGLAGQVALLFAAGLIGPLLAVYGQEYQTGADPYELFLGWAALIFPWVALARFAPAWLLLLGLANVGLALFLEQANGWWRHDGSTIALSLGVLNGAAWLLTEWLGARRGIPWLSARWLPRVLALMAMLPLFGLAEWWVIEAGRVSAAAPLGTALLLAQCGLAYAIHRRWRGEPFYIALSACMAIAIIVSLLTRVLLVESSGSQVAGLLSALFIGALVIGAVVLAVRWIRVEARARQRGALSMALEPPFADVLATLPAADAARAREVLREREHEHTPWYVRVLMGFGGWLAAAFLVFAGAILLSMLRLGESLEVRSLVLGGLLTLGALALPRGEERGFLWQLALAGSLAGEALVIGGVWMLLDSPAAAAGAALVLEGALLVLFPDRTHRFFSAVTVGGALLYLLFEGGGVRAVELGWLALAAATYGLLVEAPRLRRAALEPIAAPATLGFLCVLFSLLVLRAFYAIEGREELASSSPLMAVGVAALTAGSFWRLLLENGFDPRGPAGALVLAGLVLVTALTLDAPGVILSAGLLGLAFHRRHVVLLGLSLLFLLGFLWLHYYDLSLTLRAKALALSGTGTLLLVLRGLAIRTRHHDVPRAPRGLFPARIVFTGLAIALLVPAAMVADKERLLASGEVVLLELAPADPRSLMQGDYMVLDYVVRRDVSDALLQRRRLSADDETHGLLVLRIDEEGVGRFVRLDAGEPLAPDERRLRYREHGRHGGLSGWVRVAPDAYFFQEGHGKRFEEARYGEIKVGASGDSVLVGLRDAAKQPL